MDAIHGFRIDADSWMITMDAIRLNVLTHVSKKKRSKKKKKVLKVHNTAEHLLMDGYVYDTGAPAALKGIINKV